MINKFTQINWLNYDEDRKIENTTSIADQQIKQIFGKIGLICDWRFETY